MSIKLQIIAFMGFIHRERLSFEARMTTFAGWQCKYFPTEHSECKPFEIAHGSNEPIARHTTARESQPLRWQRQQSQSVMLWSVRLGLDCLALGHRRLHKVVHDHGPGILYVVCRRQEGGVGSGRTQIEVRDVRYRYVQRSIRSMKSWTPVIVCIKQNVSFHPDCSQTIRSS